MNDLELAEEIERKLGNMAEDFRWAITFSSSKWQQIIAALRRGPLEEWSQQVRLIVRGIDGQAERITKREQTTWRDGENQAPDEDSDFEDVVIGYKLNTGLWHRLLGLLASCPANERPPSGEMVIVPRPTGMLKPFEVIGARLLAQFDNRFGIANPIQFTDNERQVIVAALKILLAALSAAEAEGRKS